LGTLHQTLHLKIKRYFTPTTLDALSKSKSHHF
jgi:hypothetical protein